jgi:hypothetical protein
MSASNDNNDQDNTSLTVVKKQPHSEHNEILLVPPEQRRNIRYAKLSVLMTRLMIDWKLEKQKQYEDVRNLSSLRERRS